MLFAIWIRRSIKESPVFEQRADVVDGVALTKDKIKTAAKAPELTGTSTIEAALHQKKGKSFLIALGLRLGQAGNTGLVQTFLVGYLATVLLTDKTVGTDAIMYGFLLGFVTVPVVRLLGDRFGRRPLYLALSAHTAVYAIPKMLMITSGNSALITIAMVVGLYLGVLSLFAMESVTMAEFFGAPHPLHPACPRQGNRGHPSHRDRPTAGSQPHCRHRALVAARSNAHWLLVDHPGLSRGRPRGPRPRPGPPRGRRMKAVVVHGANDLRIDDRSEPVAGPGEVVLDVEWGGICGSELSYWRHGASGTAALKSPLVLGMKWLAASPDLVPASNTSRWASRSRCSRPNSWGTAPCRSACRAGPTSTHRSGTSARLRSTPHRRRLQRTETCEGIRGASPSRRRGHPLRGAGGTAGRRHARGEPCGQPAPAGTCWSAPAQSGRWSPRPPNLPEHGL
ncbi:hypothetical protein FBY30_3756 [Arthrobacter sp. SLBN-83]|nr:hypothetical protein FBY30_3756 [Arthrobacter sp. SLBN-83]